MALIVSMDEYRNFIIEITRNVSGGLYNADILYNGDYVGAFGGLQNEEEARAKAINHIDILINRGAM